MSKDKYTMRRYDLAKEMLKNVVYPGAKALDIGCYDGYFLSQFPHLDGYGMDVDGDALRVAESRGIKTFNHLNLPFRFDIIICLEVLEHLRNPEQMISNIKTLLADKGTVLISLPNECNIWTRIRMILGWGINDLPFDPEYHLHFPTIKQSDKFISKHFTIKNKRYWVYGFPKWLVFIPTLFARGVIYECNRPLI